MVSSPCSAEGPSYSHRVDNADDYNYCSVPNGSVDTILFAAIAVVAGCLLRVYIPWLGHGSVFLAGASLEVAIFARNFGHLGNAFTIFLGIEPSDILLYVFLPPWLLYVAVRSGSDWFRFKKACHHSLRYAIILSLANFAALYLVLLTALGLEGSGWTWKHIGILSAILTAIEGGFLDTQIRKEGENVSALVQSESLFSTVAAFILFPVFLAVVQNSSSNNNGQESENNTSFTIISLDLFQEIGFGALFGYVSGWITLQMLRMLRQSFTPPLVCEISLLVSVSYLVFYTSNVLLGITGVVSVVCFGLFGSFTFTFEFESSRALPAVDAVLGTLSTIFQSITFFLAGSTVANFVIRSYEDLSSALPATFVAIPLLYIALFIARVAGVYFLNGLYSAINAAPLLTKKLPFIAWAGIRGSFALLMVICLIAAQRQDSTEKAGILDPVITSQIAIWVSVMVLLSIIINGTTLDYVAERCGLLEVSKARALLSRRAREALARQTEEAIEELKTNQVDSMLHGVDWHAVRELIDPDALLQDLDTAASVARAQSTVAGMWEGLSSQPASSNNGGVVLGEVIAPVNAGSGTEEDAEQGLATPLLLSIGVDAGEEAELDAALNHVLSESRSGIFASPDLEAPFLSAWQRKSMDSSSSGSARQVAGTSAAWPAILMGTPEQRHWRSTGEWVVNNTTDPSSSASAAAGGSGGIKAHPIPEQQGEIREEEDSFAGRQNFKFSRPESPVDPLRPTETAFSNWWKRSEGGSEEADVDADAILGGSSVIEGHNQGLRQHSNQPPEALEAVSRAVLANSIKQYVCARREDGLLSDQSASLLGKACDLAIENAGQPLRIWSDVQAMTTNNLAVHSSAWAIHIMEKLAYAMPLFLQQIAVKLVKLSTRWAQNYLGSVMLRSCEIAIAYSMSLSSCDQALWLRLSQQTGRGSTLLNELHKEQTRVRKYLVAREQEAPAHFLAIQNYRASMAILRRQLRFVQIMFLSGSIDEKERINLREPIETKIQVLSTKGPRRKSQKAIDILRSIPFFAALSPESLRHALHAGTMREVPGGEAVWTANDERGGGQVAMSIVLSGIVKLPVESAEGTLESRCFGASTIFGLVPCATKFRTALPVVAPAVASSSQMHKGVLLFQVSMQTMRQYLAAAAQGSEDAKTFLLEMRKEASMQVLDMLKDSAVQQLARDWEVAAIERERDLARASCSDEGQVQAAIEAATANILLDSKDLWSCATQFAHRTVNSMRRRLPNAVVVELAPYQRYRQLSHIVLLSGSIQIQQPRFTHASQGQVSIPIATAKVAAPAVLPLCASLDFTGSHVSKPRDLLSGHEGALFVAWPALQPMKLRINRASVEK